MNQDMLRRSTRLSQEGKQCVDEESREQRCTARRAARVVTWRSRTSRGTTQEISLVRPACGVSVVLAVRNKLQQAHTEHVCVTSDSHIWLWTRSSCRGGCSSSSAGHPRSCTMTFLLLVIKDSRLMTCALPNSIETFTGACPGPRRRGCGKRLPDESHTYTSRSLRTSSGRPVDPKPRRQSRRLRGGVQSDSNLPEPILFGRYRSASARPPSSPRGTDGGPH